MSATPDRRLHPRALDDTAQLGALGRALREPRPHGHGPAWPGMETEVDELNRDPSPIAELDLEQVIDHYDEIIRGLDRPRSSSGIRSAERSRRC